MHQIIEQGLEDHLSGRTGREFENHLQQCPACRHELEQIGLVSSLLASTLKPPAGATSADPVVPAHFYARLSQTIEARKPVSPWGFFSINAAFGRRVAFASLLALAVAGGVLVSQESEAPLDLQQGPEAIIAQQEFAQHELALQESTPQDPNSERDRMMVTLASFDH